MFFNTQLISPAHFSIVTPMSVQAVHVIIAISHWMMTEMEEVRLTPPPPLLYIPPFSPHILMFSFSLQRPANFPHIFLHHLIPPCLYKLCMSSSPSHPSRWQMGRVWLFPTPPPHSYTTLPSLLMFSFPLQRASNFPHIFLHRYPHVCTSCSCHHRHLIPLAFVHHLLLSEINQWGWMTFQLSFW